jgi:hypothetical protein
MRPGGRERIQETVTQSKLRKSCIPAFMALHIKLPCILLLVSLKEIKIFNQTYYRMKYFYLKKYSSI